MEEKKVIIKLNDHWKLVGDFPDEMTPMQATGAFRLISEVTKKFGNGTDEFPSVRKIQTTWTEEDVEILKRGMKNHMTREQLTQKLNRTIPQINAKLFFLREKGILGQDTKERYYWWTSEQDKKILEMRNGKMSVSQIAEKIGKTNAAIYSRFQKLDGKR